MVYSALRWFVCFPLFHYQSSQLMVVICGDLWWFAVICGRVWSFAVVCAGLGWFAMVCHTGSQDGDAFTSFFKPKCMRYLTVHRKFRPSSLYFAFNVFNGVKLVFRLSLSLPRKIVIITFMNCKAAVRIKVG